MRDPPCFAVEGHHGKNSPKQDSKLTSTPRRHVRMWFHVVSSFSFLSRVSGGAPSVWRAGRGLGPVASVYASVIWREPYACTCVRVLRGCKDTCDNAHVEPPSCSASTIASPTKASRSLSRSAAGVSAFSGGGVLSVLSCDISITCEASSGVRKHLNTQAYSRRQFLQSAYFRMHSSW